MATEVGFKQEKEDDDPEPLVGPLSSQPGRHAGVDDHPDILRVLWIKTQSFLHVVVGSTVSLVGPNG